MLQREMEYGFEPEMQIALIHRNQCSVATIARAVETS
jgi:hypothetical protein